MDAGADLSLLEVMDRTTVAAVEAMTHMDLDTTAAALILVQSDAADARETIAACAELAHQHRAGHVLQTDDPAEGQLLLAARRAALPALERLGATLLDDVAVPQPALPEMIRRIERIADQQGLVIGTFGHAGDGNLHPTIVFQPSDPASRVRAFAAFDAILRAGVELGGTISGEHGIGSLKRDFLGLMLDPAERALLGRIKAAFDPHGILNPGKAL
jgi:D-lactate dehydrogenase (cytochrome)/glycolate oxidase